MQAVGEVLKRDRSFQKCLLFLPSPEMGLPMQHENYNLEISMLQKHIPQAGYAFHGKRFTASAVRGGFIKRLATAGRIGFRVNPRT